VCHGPRQFGHRAGLLVGHDSPAGRGEFGEVHVGQFAAVVPEHPLAEHGVVAGAPGQGVIGGEQVDGAAHEMGPHDAPFDQQVGERCGVERAQPGPESDERLLRFLRLQAAQVRDGIEDRQVGAVEQ
jgi:hypothetical protein